MNKENRRNYYRILHVQPDAPTEIIKASYRTLMQKLRAHPDLSGDEWNASVINEAYRVLTDKGQRNAYDQHLCNARSEFDPAKRRSRAPTGSTYRTTRHHPDKRSSGRHRCLFCSTESPSGIRGYSEEAHCLCCGSPQSRVASRPRSPDKRRAVKRVALHDEIQFYISWPQTSPFTGRVVDLSPLGMQFATTRMLQPHQMIKLEGRGLSAIGRILRCTRRANKRNVEHLVGVQFVTLAIKAKRAAA